MQPGLMVKNVHWALLVLVIKYIRIFILMFVLIFFLACTVDSIQKINSNKKVNKESKANVTFIGSMNSGICSNCN